MPSKPHPNGRSAGSRVRSPSPVSWNPGRYRRAAGAAGAPRADRCQRSSDPG